ncbi:MAG: sigma-70 family RNA polymerase sigma factor [Planctomycetes bacterium]|nr:sigma-70 family RNA polymerase sigma factor [Planctomycetota bacterium]
MDPTPEPQPVTELLVKLQSGDVAARSQLFGVLYGELRDRAHAILRDDHATLQPTALVHEAWLRLVPGKAGTIQDRSHFLRLAAKAMRSVLVDHVRARDTEKRGGKHRRAVLDDVCDLYEQQAVDLVALDELLGQLGELDEQLLEIVELRFFAGLDVEAVAEAMAVSKSTVERGWRTARTWLRAALEDES